MTTPTEPIPDPSPQAPRHAAPTPDADLESRLRDELTRRAAAIEPRGAGPEQAGAAASRRTRRTRLLGGVAGAAVLLGVGVTAIVLRDDPGPDRSAIQLIDGDDLSPTGSEPVEPLGDGTGDDATETPGDPEGQTPAPDGDAGSEPPQAVEGGEPTGEPGGTGTAPDAGSAADARVVELDVVGGIIVGRTEGGALVVTEDGAGSTAVAMPDGDSSARTVRLASTGTTVYALGSNATGWWLRSSEDLETWVTVPLPNRSGAAADLIDRSLETVDLEVGPDGPIITAQLVDRLRIEEILSPEVIAAEAYTIGSSTGDRSVIVVYDEVTGEVVEEISLNDLGLDPSSIERLVDGEVTPYLALTDETGALVDASASVPHGTTFSAPAVTRSGIFVSGYSDLYGEPVLWRSTDGRRWKPLPISSRVAASVGPAAFELGARLVTFTADGPLLTAQTSLNGARWNETNVGSALPAGTSDFSVVGADASGGVLAAIVDATGPDGRGAWIVLSRNGRTWAARDIGQLVPDAKGAVRDITIDGNDVVLAVGARVHRVPLSAIG